MKKITLLSLVFVLCFSISAVLAAEYEVNIDFSYGESGWGPMGSAVYYVTNEDAKVGSLSLAVLGRTQTWEGTIFNLSNVLEEGGVYEISLWIKAMEAAPGAKVWLTCVKDTTTGEAQYSQIAEPVEITSDEWVELKVEPFEFSLEGYNSIAFYVEVDDVTASYFMDDITIKGDKPINL
ncbi:MAG: hypothetical protein GX994_05575 [Firmicutes bacterium]|nr:hypothetical protein [Bacillota bacterium]